jgi:GDPmannose 4,6-dehydratase
MRALICGVSGQDGTWLAKLLLDKGYEVVGTSRDAQTTSFANLRRVGIDLSRLALTSLAPNDFRSVLQTLKRFAPDEIYNLSGQSSVGLSFEQPVETLESIATATHNFLEVIRFLERPIRFYNAGSSECFGETPAEGATEDTPFRPRSPYGVAKSTAYWQVANYREAYGIQACTGILFNHESGLRQERFVTRKIVSAACRIKRGSGERLRMGDLTISRDWGWAPEYVSAMWQMLATQSPLEDFVIATGESHSLQDFVSTTFAQLGLEASDHVETDLALKRPTDIRFSRGDASKARRILDWKPKRAMRDVISALVEDELARLSS